MKHSNALVAAVIGIGLLITTTARAADQCVPAPEAEALVLAVAPALIEQVGKTCAPLLPAGAYMRRSLPALQAKFAGEADPAWPLAREAMKKIVPEDARPMMDTELARPMMTSMMGPMLAKEIKPADCPNIDRMLGLLDPLPARNTAGLIVAIMDMAGKGKTGGKEPKICPAATGAGR